MRIAFAIVSLFPGGGLQRDCVEIAKLVRGLGHDVTIYTCRLHDHTLAYNIPILLLQNDAIDPWIAQPLLVAVVLGMVLAHGGPKPKRSKYCRGGMS